MNSGEVKAAADNDLQFDPKLDFENSSQSEKSPKKQRKKLRPEKKSLRATKTPDGKAYSKISRRRSKAEKRVRLTTRYFFSKLQKSKVIQF